MKSILLFPFFFSLVCLPRAWALDDKKDWVLDLKTSTLIPDYVGKIKMMRGKAMAAERELQKGDKIYPKSLIKTADKSVVVLELVDETTITIGPHSEFSVEGWAYRTKKDRNAIYSLITGKIRAHVKVKSQEADQLKIKSSLVSMGIRGTEVLVNSQWVGEKDVTQVGLLEGKVALLSHATGRKMNLLPHDYVEISGGALEKNLGKSDGAEEEFKRAMTSEEIDNLNQTLSGGEKPLLNIPVSWAKLEGQEEEARDPLKKELEVFQESRSWKENLEKLNELRRHPR